MEIAVEISYYPMLKEYESPIIRFIQQLKQHAGIQVATNGMSTQIVGEYDLVMKVLTEEIKRSFTEEQISAMVMKILNKPVELKYRVI